MLIVPALEYEKKRQQPADWDKVILHREGKFYRVYGNPAKLYRSINSMLGVLSHFDDYRLSRELFCVEPFLKHGHFSDDMTHYYLNRKTQ